MLQINHESLSKEVHLKPIPFHITGFYGKRDSSFLTHDFRKSAGTYVKLILTASISLILLKKINRNFMQDTRRKFAIFE